MVLFISKNAAVAHDDDADDDDDDDSDAAAACTTKSLFIVCQCTSEYARISAAAEAATSRSRIA